MPSVDQRRGQCVGGTIGNGDKEPRRMIASLDQQLSERAGELTFRNRLDRPTGEASEHVGRRPSDGGQSDRRCRRAATYPLGTSR